MRLIYMLCICVCMISLKANIIHDATKAKDLKRLYKLLANSDNRNLINEPDEFGNTPLHYAAEAEWADGLTLLLANGAKGKKNGDGLLPHQMHPTCASQASDRVSEILKHYQKSRHKHSHHKKSRKS